MQSLIILLFLIKIIFKKDKYLLNKREKELLKYLIAKGVPFQIILDKIYGFYALVLKMIY